MNKCEWKDGKFEPCDEFTGMTDQKKYIASNKTNCCLYCGADIRKPEAKAQRHKYFTGRIVALEVDCSKNIRTMKISNEDGMFIPFGIYKKDSIIDHIVQSKNRHYFVLDLMHFL